VRGTFNVAHANAAKREDGWRSKDGGQEEHSLIGDKGSADREIRPDRERKRAQTNRRHRECRNRPRRAYRDLAGARG
jgi:hypothetical protein